MKLPRLVRTTVRTTLRAATSHRPEVADVLALAARAPATAMTAARGGANLGAAAYAVLMRTGALVADRALAAATEAKTLLRREQDPTADRESDPPAAVPTADPWTGGPLRPADDIRAAVFLTQDEAAAVEATPAGATLTHDDLPLADYDHLTLGELRARIRRLGVPELVQLREYEHAHADRLPVVKAFDNRLATLAKASAAQEQVPAP